MITASDIYTALCNLHVHVGTCSLIWEYMDGCGEYCRDKGLGSVGIPSSSHVLS